MERNREIQLEKLNKIMKQGGDMVYIHVFAIMYSIVGEKPSAEFFQDVTLDQLRAGFKDITELANDTEEEPAKSRLIKAADFLNQVIAAKE